jgi:hypothetical protein
MAIGEKIKAPEESHRANSGRSTKQEKPAGKNAQEAKPKGKEKTDAERWNEI